MNIAVVKYNAGNICSVMNALGRLGVDARLTDDPAELRQADKVVFPGQGEAATAMHYLRERGLDEVIRSLEHPVLGICVGQQLLCQHSEEGDVDCLGIFSTDVRRFRPGCADDKVPAMGWNKLGNLRSPLFEGLTDPYVYFVHSYYCPLCAETAATTHHILDYSAALQRDNFFATQFHPEKSGSVGEQILKNFLSI
ncbi:MAG: imidazole glycerol phosphate synthase subunit HisH [Prevotella sp.]|nr:imidazole glycerol phosphate synthase subunit HisH [Prevotella sp.]